MASAPSDPPPLCTPLQQSNLDDAPLLLEALLNDCFRAALNKSALSPERMDYVDKFHKYLLDLHCHENLAFIIDIYCYEYFYDKLAPDAPLSDSRMSSSFLNSSLETFIENLPYPTTAMSRRIRKSSFKSQSISSLPSGEPFDLEIDDIPESSRNAWDSFGRAQMGDVGSDSDSSSDLDSPSSSTLDLETLVADQWRHIVTSYIDEHLPCQINLCNKTARLLRNQTVFKEHLPSPLVLMKAKDEVIRLIDENAYHSFVKSNRCSRATCACSIASSGSSRSTPKSSTLDARRISSLGSPLAAEDTIFEAQVSSTKTLVVAPVPHKRKLKVFNSISGSSSSEISSSPINAFNNFLGHLKPQASNGHLNRNYSSAPQSPAASISQARGLTPESDLIQRPRSNINPEGYQNPSLFGKLWGKKKR